LEFRLAYDWPRNVRQLANEMHRLVVWADNDTVIGADRLSSEIRAGADPRPGSCAAIVGDNIVIPLSLPYSAAKDELERLTILFHGNDPGRVATPGKNKTRRSEFRL
jgi:DNA-binding NtrC family response regulator